MLLLTYIKHASSTLPALSKSSEQPKESQALFKLFVQMLTLQFTLTDDERGAVIVACDKEVLREAFLVFTRIGILRKKSTNRNTWSVSLKG